MSINNLRDRPIPPHPKGWGLLGRRVEKKMDHSLDKQDQMLDKQETTIGEIGETRNDLKTYMDMRFERIESKQILPN